MTRFRNHLVVAFGAVLACATVAAGMANNRHAEQPHSAISAGSVSASPSFSDPSVPAASVVFPGADNSVSESAPTF